MSELAKEPVLKTGEPARGLGSSPSLIAIYAQIAQSVEQRTENPRVRGSIPRLGTTCSHSSVGRAPALQAGGHRFKSCCEHHL